MASHSARSRSADNWRLAFISALLALHGSLKASIFEIDDRISSINGGLPVGLIEGWSKSGSGFLINRCHAMTAKHVVGTRKTVGKRVSFRLQPWLERDESNWSRGTVVAAGVPSRSPEDFVDDWAIIKLDRCLGEKFGYFEIASDRFYVADAAGRIGPQLMSIGYPIDRSRQAMTVDPNCEVRRRSTRGLLHDCATMSGNSGGPILAWNYAKAKYEAVGIIVAGHQKRFPVPFEVDKANVAVDLALAIPKETKARLKFQ